MNEQSEKTPPVRCSALLDGIVSKSKQVLGYGSEDRNSHSDCDYPYWLFIPWLIGLLFGFGIL